MTKKKRIKSRKASVSLKWDIQNNSPHNSPSKSTISSEEKKNKYMAEWAFKRFASRFTSKRFLLHAIGNGFLWAFKRSANHFTSKRRLNLPKTEEERLELPRWREISKQSPTRPDASILQFGEIGSREREREEETLDGWIEGFGWKREGERRSSSRFLQRRWPPTPSISTSSFDHESVSCVALEFMPEKRGLWWGRTEAEAEDGYAVSRG